MNTDNNDDMTLDDEVLRENAMTEGVKKVSKFILRPMTAESFSWVQRMGLFEDGNSDVVHDPVQVAAAYALLHTAERSEIRHLVQSRERFFDAVDVWMDANLGHHSELEPVTNEMNEAVQTYISATTTASNPSDAGASGAKN
jgi:hypothetical protein